MQMFGQTVFVQVVWSKDKTVGRGRCKQGSECRLQPTGGMGVAVLRGGVSSSDLSDVGGWPEEWTHTTVITMTPAAANGRLCVCVSGGVWLALWFSLIHFTVLTARLKNPHTHSLIPPLLNGTSDTPPAASTPPPPTPQLQRLSEDLVNSQSLLTLS